MRPGGFCTPGGCGPGGVTPGVFIGVPEAAAPEDSLRRLRPGRRWHSLQRSLVRRFHTRRLRPAGGRWIFRLQHLGGASTVSVSELLSRMSLHDTAAQHGKSPLRNGFAHRRRNHGPHCFLRLRVSRRRRLCVLQQSRQQRALRALRIRSSRINVSEKESRICFGVIEDTPPCVCLAGIGLGTHTTGEEGMTIYRNLLNTKKIIVES